MSMVRFFFIFFMTVLTIACSSFLPISITGSGNIVTREEGITGFDKIDVSHAFDVEISHGDFFNVLIQVDDNMVEHLDVSKLGGTLRIGLKSSRIYDIKDATLQAEITMPELVGLNLSGSSKASITGFRSSKNLDLGLSGSSLAWGDIEAGDARFDLSGSSSVNFTGSAQDLNINASGSSVLDLSDFQVINADIQVSGSSSAKVNPSGTLDVDASGASDITYLGNPTLGNINTSGSSVVQGE